MALGPPPVAAGSHDSFQTTFWTPPAVVAKYAELKLPSALNGMSLVGFQAQPSWSCVPPTAVTYGLEAGQPAVGTDAVAVSFFCFSVPRVPSSPEEAKNVSPFAIPFWKTASNFEVCAFAAPPKVCSVIPKLIENTVPPGLASI